MSEILTKIPIDENFETILTCAIRYAIGRQTYMPHLVIDYITPLLPILSDKALSVMKNDVATAEHYGNDMIDKPAWMEFYAKVLNEIERR